MCFPTIIFMTLGSYVKVGWEMSSISKDEVYVLYMEKRNGRGQTDNKHADAGKWW